MIVAQGTISNSNVTRRVPVKVRLGLGLGLTQTLTQATNSRFDMMGGDLILFEYS